jgi:hypothetical protein
MFCFALGSYWLDVQYVLGTRFYGLVFCLTGIIWTAFYFKRVDV